MQKIDLIIIGAQKAGTTSLHNYLREHPELHGHQQVEFAYFVDDKEYEQGFNASFTKYFTRKPKLNSKKIIAKNVSICLHEKALLRLKEHNPECKIIYLLREPVSRAYSAYTMSAKDGWMTEQFDRFDNILRDQDYNHIMYRHFVKHGFYAEQLSIVLKHFNPSTIRILLFEDLKGHPKQLCEDIFTWLDVDNTFLPNLQKTHNPTTKPKSILIGNLITQLRARDSIVKLIVKKILPYSWFSQLGSEIQKMNASRQRFEPIPKDTRHALLLHFEKYNQQLWELLSKEEVKDCLKIYGDHDWINSPLNQEEKSLPK